MSAILLASLLLAIQEAPLRRPPPSTADLPSWSKTPTADEMKAAYPAEAAKTNYAASATVSLTAPADAGPQGWVAFSCRVRASGSLDNCVVVDAKPRSSGAFNRAGEAALRVKAPASSAEFSRILIMVAVR